MTDTPRDPESVVLEAEYWRQVLAITAELNGHVSAGAAELVGVNAGALTYMATDRWPEAVTTQSKALTAAMERLRVMQELVADLGNLAGGRLLPLYREAGLEPPEGLQ